MFGKYLDDFEYYEVRVYIKGEFFDEWGDWDFGYEYVILMDIFKWDVWIFIIEIVEKFGKLRFIVRYMINCLKEKGILINFVFFFDMNVLDWGIIGIVKEFDEEVFKWFNDYEIIVGVFLGEGYILEWFFFLKEDMGLKILEFSRYVEKIFVEYFDLIFKEFNDRNFRMVF